MVFSLTGKGKPAVSAYLKGLRERHTELMKMSTDLQNRAVAEKRDLTPDELKLIQDAVPAGLELQSQIEMLSGLENRENAVNNLAGKIDRATDAADQDDQHNRGADQGDQKDRGQNLGTGGAQTRDRDPGHYRKVGGEHSFFQDMYRSKVMDDISAARRLGEHSRALATGTEGVGLVAPKWMTEEFELLARQGRRLANAVRNIPLGDDPRPLTLPKQTVGVDAVVAQQVNENDVVGGADAYDTDVDVVTPKPTAGKQTVSRQMVDMASPAIDTLIYGDLMAVYNLKVETKVGAAMVAAAGAATATFATEAAFAASNGGAALDAVVDVETEVLDLRKLPATLLAMGVRRWARFLKFKDTTGRPLITSSVSQAVNVAGVGSVQADGIIEDLPVIRTDGISTGAYPDSIIAARASDTLLFESNMLRFRFEEILGPQSVVLGIWGYTAVICRQAGKSIKRIVVTAA